MPQFIFQASYTAESLRGQIENPQDRVGPTRGAIEAVGGSLVFAGWTFGDYDFICILDAPDEVSAAGVAVAFAAGGAVKTTKTTRVLSGDEWLSVLGKSAIVRGTYKPPVS